ncbi:fimbrillin family protein [Bacteroides sp.]
MKKLMFTAIVCVTALAGCSSEDDCATDAPLAPEPPVEIKVSAGIPDVTYTRAPVNTNDNVTASFVASATDGDYTTNAWVSTIAFVASPTPTAAQSFTPSRFYPTNGSSVYIKGYYPAGTLSGKTVTYVGNGTEDVMITSQATGTKTTVGALAFTFNHLLTQLQFQFKSGTGYPASGNSVTKIVIKSQKTPATLDLNTGAITYATNDVTLNGSYAITTAGATAADCPMMKSGEPIVLSVTTSDGVVYPDATISLTTLTGSAHLITLTLTPKEITATVSVTAWATGGGGSSTLQ